LNPDRGYLEEDIARLHDLYGCAAENGDQWLAKYCVLDLANVLAKALN
jgi:hypothetical protein